MIINHDNDHHPHLPLSLNFNALEFKATYARYESKLCLKFSCKTVGCKTLLIQVIITYQPGDKDVIEATVFIIWDLRILQNSVLDY